MASLRGRFQQPGFAASQHWSDFARHTAVQLRDIVDAMQAGCPPFPFTPAHASVAAGSCGTTVCSGAADHHRHMLSTGNSATAADRQQACDDRFGTLSQMSARLSVHVRHVDLAVVVNSSRDCSTVVAHGCRCSKQRWLSPEQITSPVDAPPGQQCRTKPTGHSRSPSDWLPRWDAYQEASPCVILHGQATGTCTLAGFASGLL